MSDVEFYEEERVNPSFKSDMLNLNKKETGIIGFLIRRKIAKSRQQANLILLIVIIICLALTIFFLVNASRVGKSGKILYKEDIPKDQLKNYPPIFIDSLPSRKSAP